eukprot:6213109-Pleurochrysis_carterae.AAC.4
MNLSKPQRHVYFIFKASNKLNTARSSQALKMKAARPRKANGGEPSGLGGPPSRPSNGEGRARGFVR